MASDWTYGSVQDMTNGGSDNLSEITVISGLSGVVSIQVMFYLYSVNIASQALLLQLGDSGGFETTDYIWSCNYTSTTQAVTSGLLHSPNGGQASGDTASGIYDILRYRTDSNLWMCKFSGMETTKGSTRTGMGNKTLSGDLTQIQATTTGGTALFDNGQIVARYK